MELPMPKKLKSKKFASIRAMILDLEDLIDGQKWLLDHQAAEEWRSSPWDGAETVICEVLPADPHPGKTYVATCILEPVTGVRGWLFTGRPKARGRRLQTSGSPSRAGPTAWVKRTI